MRRALVQVVLSLGAGGTERLVIEMCERLHHDTQIEVVCLDAAGEWAYRVATLGIRVTVLERRPGFQWRLAAGIRRIAKTLPAPVIHCHHYTPFIYGCLAGLTLPGSKIVYTEHGRYSDGSPSMKRRLANQFFGRTPGRFFAVSHDLRRHLISEGLPAARLEVNHNGIDPGPTPQASARADARANLGLAGDDWTIGTVARLDPVKNLGLLVQAAAHLYQQIPTLKLVFIGDGPDRVMLERACAQAGIAARTVFTGQRDDARALLAGLDTYVNCSVIEGISVTLLEALAAGLAVVATQVGGTPEILRHEDQGLLIPSRDAQALTAALARIHTDEALRRHLQQAARAHIESAFSIEHMLKRYTDAYGW
ncbi:MAG: glycosyltransferase [Gammaproteobacteria bacterium]|nr:glycosyltransferase [Gammaproteobacteria bacterium]